ncbi:MAG: cytochrome c [SAR324 cluster bacterium]|nr:cytochrome c [SAR324 cluster bacterium]
MKNKILFFLLLTFLFALVQFSAVFAETVTEEFKIEGLISPASPKALKSGLEEKLKVKIVDLNLKSTDSGWPVLSVEFDSGSVSKEKIETTIASIKDPAGHTFKVHNGPLRAAADLLKEEIDAISVLGAGPPQIQQLKNPTPKSDESIGRGKGLYDKNCSKCHGLYGNGNGPVAHGFDTQTRPLNTWTNADSSVDGYLFWYITNGRTDMPPWGIVLSANERWDIINYIKTLKK